MDTAKRRRGAEIEPTLRKPEVWQERRMIMEYNLADFSILDQNPLLSDNQSDVTLHHLLVSGIPVVKRNKYGYLKDTQQHYYYAGDEAPTGDQARDEILIGKIDDTLCILGDDMTKVIVSPLFHRLLAVNKNYVDVELSGQRLRFSAGNFQPANVPDTTRTHDLLNATELPGFMSLENSVKISVLERTSLAETVKVTASVESHPREASAQLFEKIESKVLDHITSGEATNELAEQLLSVDRALHMPAVDIEGQSYTVTLRTSTEADIIFLHNSNIHTDQDRIADEMQKMSIPDFLELAHDNNLQRELLSSVLNDRGFHFVRQHNGQFFIMGRDMHANSMVTPDKPYYASAFEQIELQLSEYFRALHVQKPVSTPLRAARIAAGIAIQREAEERENRRLTIPRRILNWLGYFE